MRTLIIFILFFNFTSCISQKYSDYYIIKSGLHVILGNISKKNNNSFIIYDSIIINNDSFVLDNNNFYTNNYLKQLFEKAIKNIIIENNRIYHSNDRNICNIELQNPKFNVDSSIFIVDIWINKNENIKYKFYMENSKLTVKKLEHYYLHVEGNKLINIDSTKYDSNYIPIQIESLPNKKISDLNGK